MGICNHRTVIITGSGSGLGKAHALAFAQEGANVVVNDLNLESAKAVASDIVAQGGKAIANAYNITSMAESQLMVNDAIAAFGDVHVLVNNAGITRDRMFASLSEQEWDQVIAVHLKGHFCLASILTQHWRNQSKAGQTVNARIINTTSGAGLQGSVGQSNYAAAKGGIAALTLVQAAELKRYGVTSNAIAPAARTNMTEVVFAEVMKKPEDGFDFYDPANVSPLIVWLGSEASSHVTGHIFESAGGQISIADGWRTGPVKDKKARWAPAEVGEAVDALLSEIKPAQKVYGT